LTFTISGRKAPRNSRGGIVVQTTTTPDGLESGFRIRPGQSEGNDQRGTAARNETCLLGTFRSCRVFNTKKLKRGKNLIVPVGKNKEEGKVNIKWDKIEIVGSTPYLSPGRNRPAIRGVFNWEVP